MWLGKTLVRSLAPTHHRTMTRVTMTRIARIKQMKMRRKNMQKRMRKKEVRVMSPMKRLQQRLLRRRHRQVAMGL
eukprot:symbB.v1.2.002557.t1/scaffold136.1/size304296/10